MAGSNITKGDDLAAKIIVKIDRILYCCYRLEDKTEIAFLSGHDLKVPPGQPRLCLADDID
ncbi:hypothetical protein C0Q70_10317 [Pomacea canaliculata]|uniref:Uncharacterized protein n=1 Tax=Pomacea canaliculata TaxID=400727 RepID=A0A2T7PCA1_POMCA|nr:hypothetical protein C0Q70_10317 [Pomacea canaliculata]